MIELGQLAHGIVPLEKTHCATVISGISADSRQVKAGHLFAALPGSNVDGRKFIQMAIDNGAVAVLTSDVGDNVVEASSAIPIITTPDPRLALALMAARLFPHQPGTMVAVTGTAGKTSVAEFLRQIWQGCGQKAASIGTTGVTGPDLNQYGNLTTPDPVSLHRLLETLSQKGVTHAAMEASSHGLHQKRLHGVRLSAAGFTNLGRDHLDYHDGLEDYFLAKMSLFSELLPSGSPAVVFADDPYSQRCVKIAGERGHEVLQVGRGGDFLCLKRVEHERYSQIAEITYDNKTHRIKFPLAGDFQIANALVAAGLALATGEEISAVMAGLEQLKGASGRLELIGHSRLGAPVYVDYAHKPDALEHVLNSLRPFAVGSLVVVIGCGGDRDPGKRPIMGAIADRLADRVVITDDNPRSENPELIRKAILSTAPGATEIADRRQAIRAAISELRQGDCLVIAGKGHETGQIVGNNVLEFSDHEEVRRALEEAV